MIKHGWGESYLDKSLFTLVDGSVSIVKKYGVLIHVLTALQIDILVQLGVHEVVALSIFLPLGFEVISTLADSFLELDQFRVAITFDILSVLGLEMLLHMWLVVLKTDTE